MTCRYQLRRTVLNPASAAALELISLDKEIVKFGRNPEQVQVVLHSNLCPNMISREHGHIRQIRNNDGSVSYYLFDTSLNGTYVNDVRVNSSVLLHPGDTVKFGHVNGAAMAPGQLAPQPYAEFAYTFEKVPRSTSSQVHTASIAAQQVQAAAYDAAARRLAASPHPWPPNPYAQLAATPAAAAAYFAATGFSHPYLGHITPGLLTPPPSAAAAAVAASALSTTAAAASQPSPANVAAFSSGSYPGMVGGPTQASVGAHHQQQTPFRPPSAVMAAAAAELGCAAWLGVASVGQGTQSLPVYHHHQAAASTPQLPLGGHLNSSTLCPPNASISSIGQNQRQQPHLTFQQQQQQPQQECSIQNRTITASNPFMRKPADREMETFASLSMQQKRPDQLQQPLVGYPSTFGHQQLRTQQYATPQPLFGNVSTNDTMISSNLVANAATHATDKMMSDYLHAQNQAQVRALRPDHFQHQHSEMRKNMPSSPSDCEILPPPPSSGPELAAIGMQQACGKQLNADCMVASVVARDAPIRDSVVVDTQSVVRTYADASTCVTTMATTPARVNQTCGSTNEQNGMDQSVTTSQLSPSNTARGLAIVRGDLQKAECDSSVPSPPEDPVRRKSTGTSGSSAVANACDDVQIIDADNRSSSLNSDLLRLAADARSRCLNASANGQDDVFDLEPVNGDTHENPAEATVIAPASSSSLSLSPDHSKSGTKVASMSASEVADNATSIMTHLDSPCSKPAASPVAQDKDEESQRTSATEIRKTNKKQRSNEVKRLFDDLQSSYLFNQMKAKPRSQSTDSQSSTDASETSKTKKKDQSSVSSTSSSRSQSADSSNDKEVRTRRPSRNVQPPKRSGSASSSASSSSSSASSSSEKSTDDDDSPSRRRLRSRSQGQKKKVTNRTDSTANRSHRGLRNAKATPSGTGDKGGRKPARRSAAKGSSSSLDVESEAKKRKRTSGAGTATKAGNRKTTGGGTRRRRKGEQEAARPTLPVVRPEDTWKYHDPTQACAAGGNCIKPDGDNVDWVECDDCQRWFHVNCVGCAFEDVKDEDTAFHCGCAT